MPKPKPAPAISRARAAAPEAEEHEDLPEVEVEPEAEPAPEPPPPEDLPPAAEALVTFPATAKASVGPRRHFVTNQGEACTVDLAGETVSVPAGRFEVVSGHPDVPAFAVAQHILGRVQRTAPLSFYEEK